MKAIHIEVANYGQAFVQKINYGYACFSLTEAAVDKLLLLKESIRRFYDNIRTKTMTCLCDIELQRIKEKVGQIIDLVKCGRSTETDIRYDYSQYDDWVIQNPSCVAYDVWEKGMVKLNQPMFVVSASKAERAVRTLYAVASKDTSGCVIKLLAYAHKAKCENKLVVSAKNTAKCKIELAALTKKHRCDMSIGVYSTLLKCNLSFNVVSTILGCGGRFSVDPSGTAKLKVGSRSSTIDDVVKLAGGTWQDMNEAEFNEIYG